MLMFLLFRKNVCFDDDFILYFNIGGEDLVPTSLVLLILVYVISNGLYGSQLQRTSTPSNLTMTEELSLAAKIPIPVITANILKTTWLMYFGSRDAQKK